MDNNKVVYKYKHNNPPCIVLNYSNKKFSNYDIEKYYNMKNNNRDVVEFLPGVYYKKIMKYKLGFLEKNFDAIEKSKFKLLRALFYFLLDKLLFEKQNIEVIFQIENKRDDIKISIDGNVVFSQFSPNEDNLESKYEKGLGNEYEYDYTIEYKEVETSKIMYPFCSGGDGSRCRIKGIFGQLGLLNGFYDDEYIFFDEHEMFLASANSESLIEECKKFKSCMVLYERFSNNTYMQPKPDYWGDNIKLTEFNGLYKISNANHRVCCAKRFKIPTVYAEVCKYTVKKEKETKEDNYICNNSQNHDNEKILKNFYKTLYELGIETENAHYILKNGLRGKELVKYIEDTTSRTLYELCETI